MSKVRINDLARELEVKPRAIIDLLPGLGVDGVKTHSSSLELDEAEKVRAHFVQDQKPGAHATSAASRHAQGIVPKIDLSHISKPGDVMKAILAKQKEEEVEARHPHVPAKPVVPAKPAVHAAPAAPAASSGSAGCSSSARTPQDRSAAALCSAHHRSTASGPRNCFAAAVSYCCGQGSRRRSCSHSTCL